MHNAKLATRVNASPFWKSLKRLIVWKDLMEEAYVIFSWDR